MVVIVKIKFNKNSKNVFIVLNKFNASILFEKEIVYKWLIEIIVNISKINTKEIQLSIP